MFKAMDRWLPTYLGRQILGVLSWRRVPVRHLILCIADHYEPFGRMLEPAEVFSQREVDAAHARIEQWAQHYAACYAAFRDSSGRAPRYTFFYPWDEYHPEILALLQSYVQQGWGEVEVHLHHRDDNADSLAAKLTNCRDTYANVHGLLGRDPSGNSAFAFVHGNWALCNSRPDGDWCGVDHELAVLKQVGCYADLTFPSAPSETQPRIVNSIYYGRDHESGCGHIRTQDVSVGGTDLASDLMMIQGPLGINIAALAAGGKPRIENGEFTVRNGGRADRLATWLGTRVHVKGFPECAIVKLHTHGLSKRGGGGYSVKALAGLLEVVQGVCRERAIRLHYMTARELYNVIRAIESGKGDDAFDDRDSIIKPPPIVALAQ